MKLLKTFALAEGTKSNDSWCVGEVDPGKRLVFRKSLSCKYPEPWCGVWCTYIHTYILASCLRNLHALVYSASGAVCPVPGSWSSVAEPCVLRSSGLPRRARHGLWEGVLAPAAWAGGSHCQHRGSTLACSDQGYQHMPQSIASNSKQLWTEPADDMFGSVL